MAKLVFGMNQSLDGYVDHLEMRTGPALFRHWIEHVRDLNAVCTVVACTRPCVMGTKTVLSGVRSTTSSAAAWRRQPKWVVSRSLKSVGPDATLVEDDIEAGDTWPEGSARWGDCSFPDQT